MCNRLSFLVHFLRFIVLLWQLLMVDGNGLLHPRGNRLITVTLMHSLQFSSNSMVRIATLALVEYAAHVKLGSKIILYVCGVSVIYSLILVCKAKAKVISVFMKEGVRL